MKVKETVWCFSDGAGKVLAERRNGTPSLVNPSCKTASYGRTKEELMEKGFEAMRKWNRTNPGRPVAPSRMTVTLELERKKP